MTGGQQIAVDVIAAKLRDTFPAATDIDFDAVALSIVAQLDLAAIAYMDQRHRAFDKAVEAMIEYDGIIKRNLHNTIDRLTTELAQCNRLRSRLITTGKPDA